MSHGSYNPNDRFGVDLPPAKSGLSGCQKAFLGCGVIALLLFLLMSIAGWYAWTQRHAVLAYGGKTIANAAVDGSNLSPDDKVQVKLRIERIADDVANQRISPEQAESILQHVFNGPLIYVGGVLFIEKMYIEPSELSYEEKAAAVRTVQRLARGLYEGTISQEDLDEVNAPISKTDSEGKTTYKDKVTLEELKQMLSIAQEKVDAAGVPDEPFKVDIGAELDRAIEAGLAGKPIETHADPSAESTAD